MRWCPDPHRPDAFVLRCSGTGVGGVHRDLGRWLARVRFAHVHLIALFACRDEARRFVERELWSEAGELAPQQALPRAGADAGAFPRVRPGRGAAAAPVHPTLRRASAESSRRTSAATIAPHRPENSP